MENFDTSFRRFFDDDRFIQWVLHPGEEMKDYWDKWMSLHPKEIEELLQAKELLLGIIRAEKTAEPSSVEDLWHNIYARIQPDQSIARSAYHPGRKISLLMAACLAGLMVIVAIVIKNSGKPTAKASPVFVQSFIKNDKLNRLNKTSKSHIVYLVDGTKVTLQPGSSIEHLTFLQKNKREVFLHGSAFFQVAKDSARPFYVYANNVVLRVLGTSFEVTTEKNNKDVTVLVQSGKVAVKARDRPADANIILTPNEQIYYDAQKQQMIKTKQPEKAAPGKKEKGDGYFNFDFEAVPVSSIFSQMEKAYGIKIVYEKEIGNRIVTSFTGDESFEGKMNIICDATGTSYSIRNNEVFVHQNNQQ